MTNLPPICGLRGRCSDPRGVVHAGAGSDRHDDRRIRPVGIVVPASCARARPASSSKRRMPTEFWPYRMTRSPGSRFTPHVGACHAGNAMAALSIAATMQPCSARVVERQVFDASPRFRSSGLRSASRDAGTNTVLAAQWQGDLHYRLARRRAAPVGASPGHRHLRLSARQRQPAVVRPVEGGAAEHGRPRRAHSRIRLERQGCGSTGTSASITTSAACRTATPSFSAGRWFRPSSPSASPAGLPAQPMPMAACTATPSSRSRLMAKLSGTGRLGATWSSRNIR